MVHSPVSVSRPDLDGVHHRWRDDVLIEKNPTPSSTTRKKSYFWRSGRWRSENGHRRLRRGDHLEREEKEVVDALWVQVQKQALRGAHTASNRQASAPFTKKRSKRGKLLMRLDTGYCPPSGFLPDGPDQAPFGQCVDRPVDLRSGFIPAKVITDFPSRKPVAVFPQSGQDAIGARIAQRCTPDEPGGVVAIAPHFERGSQVFNSHFLNAIEQRIDERQP